MDIYSYKWCHMSEAWQAAKQKQKSTLYKFKLVLWKSHITKIMFDFLFEFQCGSFTLKRTDL